MSKSKDMSQQRLNVINEIIKTENIYNMGLQMMNGLFLQQIQKRIKEDNFVVNPLIPKFLEKLTQIQMISDTLQCKLNDYLQSKDENKSIGKCFEQFPKLLIIYFDYIGDFHKMTSVFDKEKQINRSFNELVQSTEAKLGDTIQSFLITPVQRPPRYRLLLQELLKTTPEDSEDYKLLKIAFDKICEEILKVDKAVEEFDEAVKMGELQSRLSDFDFFDMHRRLYYNDDAIKFSRKRTNNRYIIIFNDFLIVAEAGILPGSLKVNKKYMSGEYLIVPVSDSDVFKNSVDLRQKDKSFRMNLPSPKSKEEILNAFQKVLNENKINQTELELKGFAPVWIPDDQAPTCMSCGCKFSFINRRHHCRYCGDCICKNCFNNKIHIPGKESEEPENVCKKCYLHIKEITQSNDDNSDEIAV